MKRTTGVTVRVEIEYSNQDLDSKRPVIGKDSVHAFVRAKAEHATWTGGQTWVRWREEPRKPRDEPQEYELVERSRQGVLFLRLPQWVDFVLSLSRYCADEKQQQQQY